LQSHFHAQDFADPVAANVITGKPAHLTFIIPDKRTRV
jgi:hypothetical protein